VTDHRTDLQATGLRALHVTGARPNFPKAAPVLAALADRGVHNVLVHTGQHYDEKLSEVFFRQLGLPEPDVNLGVGSGTHARQTAAVMTALEDLVTSGEQGAFDVVVVYGDVNSTVAAALVAAKEQVPLVHVEAGLRSFDPSMPEEVNRVVTDRLSNLLLATSGDAVEHLLAEGTPADSVVLVGNPMIDTLLANLERFDEAAARAAHGLDGDYAVATLHRPGNVDDPRDVAVLVAALHRVADRLPVVLPLHPRGRDRLAAAGLLDHPAVRVVEPLGYVEFLGLVRGASVVVTDSGGVQEETTVLGVPCLTLRPNTERPVTITHGTNRLVTPDTLDAAVAEVLGAEDVAWPVPPLWDGQAGPRIAEAIVTFLVAEEAAYVDAVASA
jgi:UDP-N-acetylglucosamine 2-epimerase (non-hydrolysing)